MPDDDDEELSNLSYLVVCHVGHVTDPLVDLDTRDGLPASHKLAGYPVSLVTRSAYQERGCLEQGGAKWQERCRHVHSNARPRRDGTRDLSADLHQCLRPVTLLSNHPALLAAYIVGGAAAVLAAWDTRPR